MNELASTTPPDFGEYERLSLYVRLRLILNAPALYAETSPEDYHRLAALFREHPPETVGDLVRIEAAWLDSIGHKIAADPVPLEAVVGDSPVASDALRHVLTRNRARTGVAWRRRWIEVLLNEDRTKRLESYLASCVRRDAHKREQEQADANARDRDAANRWRERDREGAEAPSLSSVELVAVAEAEAMEPALIEAAIDHMAEQGLTRRQAVAVGMAYLGRASDAEIGIALGVSPGAVSYHLDAGRRRCRALGLPALPDRRAAGRRRPRV